MIHAVDEAGFTKRELTRKELGDGPYFNNNDFSLVDISYAPLFMRADLLGLADTLYPVTHFPKVAAWADKLLAMPELSESVVADFADLLKGHIKNKAPYAAAQLGL